MSEHQESKNTFEELVGQWTELTAQLEDFKSRVKEAGTLDAPDFLDNFRAVVLPLLDVEQELRGRVAGSDVIDNLKDSKLRSAVRALVQKGAEAAREELEEGELEMDSATEDAAWDFIYGFGTPKELLLRYRSLASVVATAEIPKRIHLLIREAKECYVLGQENAVLALGRMTLEYAITDIGVRRKLFPEPASLKNFYDDYPPRNRADLLLGEGGPRRQRFRRLYSAASQAIHPLKDAPDISVLQFLEEVLEFVGNEYAINLRG